MHLPLNGEYRKVMNVLELFQKKLHIQNLYERDLNRFKTKKKLGANKKRKSKKWLKALFCYKKKL